MPTVAPDDPIPYEVQVALIDLCGKLFWYWNDYRHFLRKAGVSQAVVQHLTGPRENKYEVMRQLLDKLDRAGPRGRVVQQRLVQAAINTPTNSALGPEDPAVSQARATLRETSRQHGLLQPDVATQRRAQERQAAEQRRKQNASLVRRRQQQQQSREQLRAEFLQLLSAVEDTQARGYQLEALVGQLAELDEMTYHPPYRKNTVTPTDGMLIDEGFRYLLEIRWRSEPADVAAIAALAHKADRALQSTRGLFHLHGQLPARSGPRDGRRR